MIAQIFFIGLSVLIRGAIEPMDGRAYTAFFGMVAATWVIYILGVLLIVVFFHDDPQEDE